MDFTKRYVVLNKIFSILTLFSLYFPIAWADGSEMLYTPDDRIALDCGTTYNKTDLSGRSWIADNSIDLDQSNKVSVISSSPTKGDSIPYKTACLSRSQFTYSFKVTPGPKFIRLHFYPTVYREFNRSNAFFDVVVAGYTLLRNFSPALTADYLRSEVFSKEFCINVDSQKLNILFAPNPSMSDSYAFINGIEIVSMPNNLYYSASDDTGFDFVNQVNPYRILKNQALETLYRLNVGGSSISPARDTGMSRSWSDDVEYLTNGERSALPVNLSINPSFSVIPNYSAPIPVYRTARTMGTNKTMNEHYRLTWEFQVDPGFTYFIRLHFCEFQVEITEAGDRVFQIYVDNIVAEHQADVITWAGGRGVPIYRDYAVMIGRSAGTEKKRNLSIAVHPAPAWRTKYSDAILNGIEIFKLSNDGNLAGPNPDGLPVSLPRPENSLPTPTTTNNNCRSNISNVIALLLGFVALSIICFMVFRTKSVVEGLRGSAGSSWWFQFSGKDYSPLDGSGKVYSNVCKPAKNTDITEN